MAKRPSYLFPGERSVLTVRQHPIVLFPAFLLPLAAITLSTAIPNAITGVLLLVALLRFGWRVWFWWEDRYVLTNNRMVSLEGVFTKRAVSMPLAKITDAIYERSLVGRIVGYGLLNLESAGQAGLDKIDFLPDPDNFYRAVMSLALGSMDVEAVAADE